MTKATIKKRASAFDKLGLKGTVNALVKQIKDLYASDQVPWVIGYSGGKDSTAVAQLVWLALAELPEKERFKPVHVISTDTLVENPVVAMWVKNSLDLIDVSAQKQKLPITSHALVPEIKDTFWVNLLGKGYPSPRPKFRWCTKRLKINPADTFVSNVVKKEGEAILVLGTRRAESAVRAAGMKKRAEDRKRELLSPSPSLQNAYVYSPIEDWTNDDVWLFLMQYPNPWGYNNKDLLTMYQGATADGECPLVIDTSTPSCGNSRFGCWVCTMVSQDKSMSAMIQNDQEKEWMTPLLKLRDELGDRDKEREQGTRDFRRMSGNVNLHRTAGENGEARTIPGPYTQKSRANWLRKLLHIQKVVRANPAAPPEVQQLELITLPELHEIRRIWVVDKHEIEDLLPEIYEEEVGQKFPILPLDDRQPFSSQDMDILKEVCGEDDLHFELVRELLDIERGFRTKIRRANLTERIEKAFRKSFYEDAADAVNRAARKHEFDMILQELSEGDLDAVTAVAELKNASTSMLAEDAQ